MYKKDKKKLISKNPQICKNQHRVQQPKKSKEQTKFKMFLNLGNLEHLRQIKTQKNLDYLVQLMNYQNLKYLQILRELKFYKKTKKIKIHGHKIYTT